MVRRLFAGRRVAIVAEARKRAVDLAPGAIDAAEGPMLRQAAPGVKREIVSKFLLSWRIESKLPDSTSVPAPTGPSQNSQSTPARIDTGALSPLAIVTWTSVKKVSNSG